MRFAIYRKWDIKHNRQCLSTIRRKRKVPREILYDGIKWRKPCWNLALGAGRHIFDPVGKSVITNEDRKKMRDSGGIFGNFGSIEKPDQASEIDVRTKRPGEIFFPHLVALWNRDMKK